MQVWETLLEGDLLGPHFGLVILVKLAICVEEWIFRVALLLFSHHVLKICHASYFSEHKLDFNWKFQVPDFKIKGSIEIFLTLLKPVPVPFFATYCATLSMSCFCSSSGGTAREDMALRRHSCSLFSPFINLTLFFRLKLNHTANFFYFPKMIFEIIYFYSYFRQKMLRLQKTGVFLDTKYKRVSNRFLVYLRNNCDSVLPGV